EIELRAVAIKIGLVDRQAFDKAEPFRIVRWQQVQPSDPGLELGEIDRAEHSRELALNGAGDFDPGDALDIEAQPLQQPSPRVSEGRPRRRQRARSLAFDGRRLLSAHPLVHADTAPAKCRFKCPKSLI